MDGQDEQDRVLKSQILFLLILFILSIHVNYSER
jgi:hypothetical protein